MAAAELNPPAPATRWLAPARRLQLLTILGMLAVWELIAASGLLYRGVVPSTLVIAGALLRMVARPVFWQNASVTLFEIALAFTIGSALGILAGLALGASRFAAAAFQPLINGMASTPKVIYLPLCYLLFGIGVGSKIGVGALACFFPVVIGAVAGMRQVNPVLVRVGRSFGLPWWQMAQKIYLPSLVEPIANGLRIAAGSAIGICLIAETRLSYRGLGFMVIDGYNRSRFAEVYAILVLIVLLAALGNAGIERLRPQRFRARRPSRAAGEPN